MMPTFNEYMYGVTQKDTKRVEDIITKSNGDKEKQKKLAKVMADRIEHLEKAIARYFVSVKLKQPHIAEIFLRRAEELDKNGLYRKDYEEQKVKTLKKILSEE